VGGTELPRHYGLCAEPGREQSEPESFAAFCVIMCRVIIRCARGLNPHCLNVIKFVGDREESLKRT